MADITGHEEKIMGLMLRNRFAVSTEAQDIVPNSSVGHQRKLRDMDALQYITQFRRSVEAEQTAKQALEAAEEGMNILSKQRSMNESALEQLFDIIETKESPFKPLALKALTKIDEAKVESCFVNHLFTAIYKPFKELYGGRTIEECRYVAASAFSHRSKLSIWGQAEVRRLVTENKVTKIRALGAIVNAYYQRNVAEEPLTSSLVPPKLLAEAEEIYGKLVSAEVRTGTVDILAILLDKNPNANSEFDSCENTNLPSKLCDTKGTPSSLSEFEENEFVNYLGASISADSNCKGVWRTANWAAEKLGETSEMRETFIQELLTLNNESDTIKSLTITALKGNQTDEVDEFLFSEFLNSGPHSSDLTRLEAANALKIRAHLTPNAEQALTDLLDSDNEKNDRIWTGLSTLIYAWTGEKNLDRDSVLAMFAKQGPAMAYGIKRSPEILKKIATILLGRLGLNFYDPNALPRHQIEQFASELQSVQIEKEELLLAINSLSNQATLSMEIIQKLVALLTSKQELEVKKVAANALNKFTPLPEATVTEILDSVYDSQAESVLPQVVFDYSCKQELGPENLLKLLKHLCKYNLGDKAESMSDRMDLKLRALLAHENMQELYNKTFLSRVRLPRELIESLLSLLTDKEEEKERIDKFKNSLAENGLPSNFVRLTVSELEEFKRLNELSAEEIKVIDNIIQFDMNHSSLLQNTVLGILRKQKYEVLLEMSQSMPDENLVRKLRTKVMGMQSIQIGSPLGKIKPKKLTVTVEVKENMKFPPSGPVDPISTFFSCRTSDNFKRYILTLPFNYKLENSQGTALVKKNFELKFCKFEKTAKFEDTSSMWSALIDEACGSEHDSWLHLDLTGNGLSNIVGLCGALKSSVVSNLLSLILSHNCYSYEDLTYLLEFSIKHLPKLCYIFLDHNLIFCTQNNFGALTVGFRDGSGTAICPPLLIEEKIKHLDISMNFMPRHKTRRYSSKLEIFPRLEDLRFDQRNYIFKKILNSTIFYSKYSGPIDSVVTLNPEDRTISATIGTVSLFVTKGLTSELNPTIGFSLSGHTYIVIERIDSGYGQRELIKADLVMIDKRVKIRLFRISPAEITKLRDSGRTWVRTAWVEAANIEKLLNILFASLDTSEFHTYSTLNVLRYPGHYNCFSWAVDQLKKIGINTSWSIFTLRPMGCAIV